MAASYNTNLHAGVSYSRCGQSGIVLPKISLGFWHSCGQDTDFGKSRSIVLKAFDNGITHFDLANVYGPPAGEAERRFGQILKHDLIAHRDELIISTKAGYPMWEGAYGGNGSRKHILASLDQSLSRLNIPYVDIFYSHRADQETPLEETMNALATAVHQGKALYVGLSSYSLSRTVAAARILKYLGVPCLVHQSNYNLFNRWIERDLQDTLAREGIGCVAFSPLAQGLLTDKYLGTSSVGARVHKKTTLRAELMSRPTMVAVRALNRIAQRRGQTLAQMAISWALRDDRVTSVLIGASEPQQLIENVAALAVANFSIEELREIDAHTADVNIDLWKSSTRIP